MFKNKFKTLHTYFHLIFGQYFLSIYLYGVQWHFWEVFIFCVVFWIFIDNHGLKTHKIFIISRCKCTSFQRITMKYVFRYTNYTAKIYEVKKKILYSIAMCNWSFRDEMCTLHIFILSTMLVHFEKYYTNFMWYVWRSLNLN